MHSAFDRVSFRMPTSDPPNSSARTPGIRHRGSIVARKYQLEALVGEGGMASVWSARNLKLDSRVALKLLRAGEMSDALRQRLKIEARVSAQLEHPSIVRVFDVGETELGEPFVVMELLNGEPLSHLAGRGRIPCVRAVQLMLPIAEALVLAHEKGIVHRDLKPDNVFLSTGTGGLQPKLLDFGIAKLSGPYSDSCQRVTEDGTLVGSPDYMSPEQASGGDIDHRSDIWSFCVVLYELITQQLPFRGGSNVAVLYSIIEHEPMPFPADVGIDDQLSQIIYSGLQKKPDLRPASMQELGDTLASWLLQHGVREDACGTSLEGKWSAPASTLSSAPPPRALTPTAQSRRTLGSRVVNSSGALSLWKTVSPGRNRLPWLLAALAALGLAGIWASSNWWAPQVRAKELVSRLEYKLPPPAPPVAPGAHPTVEPVAPEPAAVEFVTTGRVPRAPRTRPPQPLRSPSNATSESPSPGPSSLPGVDLMQPY